MVLEVLLRDEHLMSDLFTASEVALATEGLARTDGEALDVVVGGLGLGYTAQAALRDPRVARLDVIEFLAPVIGWHEDGLVPLGEALTSDPRCRLVQGDFFALAASGFDAGAPSRRHDAILLDIDHAPDRLLGDDVGFYSERGLRVLRDRLAPGGVFALWSDDRPEQPVTDRLAGALGAAEAVPVTFDNPYTGAPFTQTVYVATRVS